MAGHNKWSKVKHRKAVVDKRRSKAWSMCSRAIIVAARAGGGDPGFNFALRQAIDEARYYNVPGDNIERAIKKGVGGGDGDDYQPVRYEAYGPAGVALIIDALTDNRTRTAADVRMILSKHEGKLGASGSVAHMFEHRGRAVVTATLADEDRLLQAALEAGADDVVHLGSDQGEAAWEVLTPPPALQAVRQSVERAGLTVGQCGHEMLPQTTVTLTAAQAEAVAALIDALEDNEDVKRVYSNHLAPDADGAP
ncbi:MAG: YebC/PmpR family DNA-binding transcriptional regulator [Planctomyces sp.]|nr:YebC/PmpR family DNA-binding transcriptional regulator [Planctomyces sp.]MBA4119159.1 YebC/PmpR family DNA-binding transcriptional regulator [Isosphaera sp.]